MTFSLAIVGRPNVGKSTLFNRLVGKRIALVDDQPGVTRDLREGDAKLGHLRFLAIDTAGLEEATDESLQGRMRKLTESAIGLADVCLFVIDARVGVTSLDHFFADILRKKAKHVILAANKSEGRAADSGFLDSFSLGLGEPLRISAEHGEGMADLLSELVPLQKKLFQEGSYASPEVDIDNEEDDLSEYRLPTNERPLQVAVIGRPNSGKSTLINKIIGEERLLTGPEAGITRDAISIQLDWQGIPMRVFDTAGMRKKAKINNKIEKLSVGDGLRAIKFAEVVVVLLDAAIPFEQQDLRIAGLAEREGRSVVVAVNKWDVEKNKQEKLRNMREAFQRLLPELRGAPLVTVSAKNGRGIDRLNNEIMKSHKIWNKRIATSPLNIWLSEMIAAHPPPAPNGKRIKLRYITQAKSRPPGFVVMCSNPSKLPTSYSRYLVNGLREAFDLPGTPIRLTMRSQADKNPFKNRKKSQPSKLKKHL
jgi:GTP-binding protein